MKRPPASPRSVFLIAWSVAFLASPAWAAPTRFSPEEEVARIAKSLKPIPDEQWKTVAGARIAEKYEIVKGDTLYDISRRMFGDPKYWPKIWAMNNGSILNPHLIRPKNLIAFMPGTGSALPEVAIQSANDADPLLSGSDSPSKGKKGRSQEWRGLEPQPWESVQIKLPPNVDPSGFDRSSRVKFRKDKSLSLPEFVSQNRVATTGQIIGARNPSRSISLGDLVFIRPDTTLQVGDTYAVTREPDEISSVSPTRRALSYQVLGTVQITGVRDELFSATVVSARSEIRRGDNLIPVPPPAGPYQPIAAARPLEGRVVSTDDARYPVHAQHKFVYINLGSDDGIRPGMVFRVYQHEDPETGETLTDSDFVTRANIMVVQVSEGFSTGLVISSYSIIPEGSQAVLLTDLSDLTRRKSSPKVLGDPSAKPELDDLEELDRLDKEDTLGREEELELKQLENWKGNPGGDDGNLPEPTPPSTSDPELDDSKRPIPPGPEGQNAFDKELDASPTEKPGKLRPVDPDLDESRPAGAVNEPEPAEAPPSSPAKKPPRTAPESQPAIDPELDRPAETAPLPPAEASPPPPPEQEFEPAQ